MTVYNSKGLEFPTVFLVGAEDEVFLRKNDFEPRELKRKRRLCCGNNKSDSYIFLMLQADLCMEESFRTKSRFINELLRISESNIESQQ